jgi:hypothetical protein
MPTTQTGKSRSAVRKTPPAITKAAPTAAKAPKAAAPRKKKVAAVSPAATAITPEEWRKQVALAAYLRAESRGFMGGSPEQDWLDAEAELMAKFGGPPSA